MTKRTGVLFLSLIVILFLIIGCVGCGGKYSDVKQINKKYIASVEDYIADIEKADNADDAAKAINKFAGSMGELWPKMRAFSKKYPELKDKSNIPEELRESDKKVEEMGRKMAGAMMKLTPYMMNRKVMNAQKRLGSIMMKKL